MIIKFGMEVWCGNDEPNRCVYHYRGEIFDFEGDDDDDSGEPNLKVGEVEVLYVDRIRIIDEEESAFAAMDDTGSEALECYEALIDEDSGDWKDDVQELIGEDALIGDNLLIINRLEIEQRFRGKGIGAKVVEEIVKTFGSQCAVIAGKPFPLQYRGYLERPEASKASPEEENQRQEAFGKVSAFWKGVGFRKLPSSDFYVLAADDIAMTVL